MLLFFGEPAAAPFSPKKAYCSARAAADCSDLKIAGEAVDTALDRAGSYEDEWVCALRVLKSELLLRGTNSKEAKANLQRQYGTSEAEVRRLIALGMIEGAAHLERALAIAAKHQPKLLPQVHQALGFASKGAQAEAHYGAAIRRARNDGNGLAIANAENALCGLYTAQQQYARAIEKGQKALARYESLGCRGRIATASGNLGWAYQELGETDRARELFIHAESAATQAGSDVERVIWRNQIGNTFFTERRYEEAERHYQQALALARPIDSNDLPAILTNLARTSLELNRIEAARRHIAEALRVSKDDQQLRARIVAARIETAARQFARAEQLLVGAAAAAKNPATRWSAEANLAQVYARTRRNDLAERSYRRAVETVHQAREGITASELRLYFFNTATEVFGSYVDFLVENRRVVDALDATELIRAQELKEGLGIEPSSRALDARAVAKHANATILSYWLGRDRSYLWRITADDVELVTLGKAEEIEREAEAYRRELPDPARGSMDVSGARGERLYRMLLAPVAAKLPDESRVIVIPDGKLHALNFETLVVPARPRRYWIEDAIVSTAPSLRLLARGGANHGGGAMLLVGDPPEADPRFPRLPFAADEMRLVARRFQNAVVLTGPAATPVAYRNARPKQFAFVHFVAHGTATGTSPLDSAVILGRDASRDYKLLAKEIMEQPLDARLVTISSCHGAGKRTVAGEGLVGLAWAFLRAGADQVIAAQWEVIDRTTPQLMDRMYASIHAGDDPAKALRDSKLVLVRGPFNMPRYWAPFVIYTGS